MSLKNVTGDWFGAPENYSEYLLEKLNLPTTSRSGSIIFDDSTSRCFLQKQLDSMKEKNRMLELGWREMETDYENLQDENEKLKARLLIERQKSLKYFNKLKYIQDNHEIFNRLKQAYLSLKYNESMGRPMVEVREKSCQTWQVVLCNKCVTLREMLGSTSQFPAIADFTWNKGEEVVDTTVAVYKKDVEQVSDTLSKLKEVIDQREERYASNKEKEEQYKITIRNLEYENKLLQNLITLKMTEIDHMKTTETHKVELANREVLLLKKIIFKQERKQREIEKVHKTTKPSTYPLNSKEKELVDLIYSKYLDRIERKNTDNARNVKIKAQMLLDQECKTSTKKCGSHGDDVVENLKMLDGIECETLSASSQHSIQ